MDIETHFKDTFRVFSKDEEGRMFIFIIIIIIIIIIIQSRFHDFSKGEGGKLSTNMTNLRTQFLPLLPPPEKNFKLFKL